MRIHPLKVPLLLSVFNLFVQFMNRLANALLHQHRVLLHIVLVIHILNMWLVEVILTKFVHSCVPAIIFARIQCALLVVGRVLQDLNYFLYLQVLALHVSSHVAE